MKNTKKVMIFDTTLRDGQQCPGAGMSFEDNIKFAHMAAKLGIDVLEAGFPSASKLDFEIVNTICKELASKDNNMKICGLCQLRKPQVEKTIEALEPATKHGKSRLHVYLPVDPNLMKASLGEKSEDREGLVKNVFDYVSLAVNAGLEVEFSPEGYSRLGDNFDFTTDVICAAVKAGATIINCPDTIGGAYELQGDEYYVENIKKHAKIVDDTFPGNEVIWSCHNHNDFGMAVQNSLNAVFKGPVRQIEVAVNGVGERAGNASLEQVVIMIKNFASELDSKDPIYTDVRTEHIKEISDFVSEKMLPRQPHFPIVGENSARHSSGGHTNAILKDPLAYQPFDPKDVGNEISFVFGPLSGGNHAMNVIVDNGYKCDESEKYDISQFIKDFYSDRRKGITDGELLAGYFEYRKPIKITEYDYSKALEASSVSFKGDFFGNSQGMSATRKGKDSPLAALKDLIEKNYKQFKLIDYKSHSDGEGINARSVSVIISTNENGDLFEGKGEDEDIEISAMKALVDSVNKMYIEEKFRNL